VPLISAAAVRQHIASGKVQPVYLIVGDDEYEVADLIDLFTEMVDEGFRAFNVERIYASQKPFEAEAAAVEAARGLPMMSPRRVVFLLRADKLLKPKRKKGEPEESPPENEDSSETGALEAYLESPEPMTTLVVAAADANKTIRLTKALHKRAAVVECWGLKGARDVESWELPGIARKAEAWVKQRVADLDRRIDADASRALAERAGADIGRLRADLDRVLLYAGDRKRLTREDVDAVVGVELSRHEWAVNEAIKRGSAGEALKQLALLLDEGGVPYAILGQLGYLVRSGLAQANPARAREMVEALFRTDLDLKTSGGDPRVLLERLVVELCGGAAPERRPAAPGKPLRGR
jgi:DNA polymerase-3 subunit delta